MCVRTKLFCLFSSCSLAKQRKREFIVGWLLPASASRPPPVAALPFAVLLPIFSLPASKYSMSLYILLVVHSTGGSQ